MARVRRILWICVVVLLSVNLSSAQPKGNTLSGSTNSSFPARKIKLADAIETASAYKKPLLIDFYADWCLPCKVFDGERTTNAELSSALGKVHLYRVDVGKDEGIELAAKNRFGVATYPTFILVAPKQEEEAYRWSGYTLNDFIDRLNKGLGKISDLESDDLAIFSLADSELKKLAEEAFSEEDYLRAVRIYRALAKKYKLKQPKEEQPIQFNVGEKYHTPKPIFTPYDYDIFKSLVKGRIQFLQWKKEDPLKSFSIEKILTAAEPVIKKDSQNTSLHAAEVANDLSTLSWEKKFPSLNSYLSAAWNLAPSIEKSHPLTFYRLKANYLIEIGGDTGTALKAMRLSFPSDWQNDPEMVLTFSSWCLAHKTNYSEAAELIQQVVETTESDALKGKLLYRLATIAEAQDDLTEADDALTRALTVIRKYSLFYLHLEDIQKKLQKKK